MLFNPFLNLYETVFAHFISVHLFSSRLRSCSSLPNTRPAEKRLFLVFLCVYSWPCPYILYIQDHECQLLNMEYCSKDCAVLEMLECVNSMSLPSPTAGEEISNCLSSHWQHTHKHTLTQASLQLIQTELLRDSQQLIGTVSVSSFARFSHSGRKEELSKTCNFHSLPKKNKKTCKISFSFCFSTPTPQILIRELSLAWIWNAVYQKVISGPLYSLH